VLDLVGDFAKLLVPETDDDKNFAAVRRAEGSGRPLANAEFIAGLERIIGRRIARRAPGPKPRAHRSQQLDTHLLRRRLDMASGKIGGDENAAAGVPANGAAATRIRSAGLGGTGDGRGPGEPS